MSRIADALRRANTSLLEPASGPVAADVFVSAWPSEGRQAEDDDPPRVTATEPAPAHGQEHVTTPLRSRLRVVGTSPIEEFEPDWRARLAAGPDADPILVHQFRRLAASLIQLQRAQPLKSVMIASAAPGDGKTLTSLNLALVLSESYQRRVLLIEGDLRRPMISKAARLPATLGLSEIIKTKDDWNVPLVKLTNTLMLLPAGRPDPDPLAGLSSPRIQTLLHDAAAEFDWVIIDTPPVGAAADASLLCPFVDAAVLVIRARQTPYAAVDHAIETLGRERIAGIVLNAGDSQTTSGYDEQYAETRN